VAIADFIQTMLEKYGERVTKDMHKFKEELELDSPGITESVEKQFEENERSVIARRRDRLYSNSGVNADVFDETSMGNNEEYMDDFDEVYDEVCAPSTSTAMTSASGRLPPSAQQTVKMNGHRNTANGPQEEISKEKILEEIFAAEKMFRKPSGDSQRNPPKLPQSTQGSYAARPRDDHQPPAVKQRRILPPDSLYNNNVQLEDKALHRGLPSASSQSSGPPRFTSSSQLYNGAAGSTQSASSFAGRQRPGSAVRCNENVFR
jgi:hypothetical protein